MFRKAFLTLSVSAMLGMPAAVLAQFGPPPGPPPGLSGPPAGLSGPPPGLAGPPHGLGGSPPGIGGPSGGPARAGLGGPAPRPGGDAARFSRLDGPRGRGLEGNVRAFEGRSATFANRSSAYGYARAGSSNSGYENGRGRYGHWLNGVYAYGSSYGSSGCYYTSVYRRGAYRRVHVCSED